MFRLLHNNVHAVVTKSLHVQPEITRKFRNSMSGDLISHLVIGISGATNSGKSMLVDELATVLPNCSLIHQDDYFLNEGDERLLWIPELNHNNWDDRSAIEMDRLVGDIREWMMDPPHTGSSEHVPILLVDGFLLYNYRPLNEVFNKRYFLKISEAVCRSRRSKRGYIPPDVPGYFDKVVWPTYLEHLEEIRDQSDIKFLDGTDKKEDLIEEVRKEVHEIISLYKC